MCFEKAPRSLKPVPAPAKLKAPPSAPAKLCCDCPLEMTGLKPGDDYAKMTLIKHWQPRPTHMQGVKTLYDKTSLPIIDKKKIDRKNIGSYVVY